VESGGAKAILSALEDAGVKIFLGPHASFLELIPGCAVTKEFSYEYGNLGLTVEVVKDMNHAIDHINEHSSGHTECIVTENKSAAEIFLSGVDSACVFHNASNRFADGYRFGLGAEVGISTGRIHARGPVGVKGLLTTKWKLRSEVGHTVAQFSGKNALQYTHRKLQIIQDEGRVAKPRSSKL